MNFYHDGFCAQCTEKKREMTSQKNIYLAHPVQGGVSFVVCGLCNKCFDELDDTQEVDLKKLKQNLIDSERSFKKNNPNADLLEKISFIGLIKYGSEKHEKLKQMLKEQKGIVDGTQKSG